jgi:hypothetical protein
MTTFLEFKNLELDTHTVRGEFRNWVLCFDEVSGHEAIRFSVDFVVEGNDDLTSLRPVALDKESERAIRMFLANTEFAKQVLGGFFLRQKVNGLKSVDWSDWAVRKIEKINL